MAQDLPDHGRAQTDPVAGYRIVVRPHGFKEDADYRAADERLLGQLEKHRAELERRIDRAATRSLGPSIVAEIRDMRPTESVAITVAIGALYAVTGGAGALAPALAQFAGTLQQLVGEYLAELGTDADVWATLDPASVALAKAAGTDDASAWDRLAPLLAAIGTGIGVLGFVTFVGGSVQWARFKAVGLPTEETLAILPTSNLIVVGAHTLVPAILIAILAVAALFIVREAPGVGRAVFATDEGDQAQPAAAAGGPAAAPAPAPTKAEDRERSLVRALLMGIFVLLWEGVAFALTVDLNGILEWVVGIVTAIPIAAIVALIAFKTPKFLWLGATTFLAMSVFLTVVEYARARQTSDVRAAVVIRQNKKATIGFYVAETGSRIYLGRLSYKPGTHDVDPKRSRLVAFDKSQISDFAVGPPRALDDALVQANALAEELCRAEPKIPEQAVKASDPKPPPPENCRTKPPGT
jgi:hypothetical protein